MKKTYLCLAFVLVQCFQLHAQCWQNVSGGSTHTVMIKPDGTLWSCGSNSTGQLGDGTTDEKRIPMQIGVSSDWKLVSAAGNHTLAIRQDGTLWAWGDNLWGQIGDGTFGNQRETPVKIGNATDWKSVIAGRTFSLALKADGTLWTWGDNLSGQLGTGNATFVPTRVGTDSDWKMVSAGGSHTVALKHDGSLWVWGDNVDGQLGDGTTIDKRVPTKLGTATDWASVSAGYDFTIAIKTDHTLWFWGNNDSGQLGDGTLARRLLPRQLGTSADWQSVVTGYDHTVAIKTDGSLWAWGRLIGKFSVTPEKRTRPTRIATTFDWASIHAGEGHAFGFKTDGSLWAWGDNLWGQLGSGTSDDRTAPAKLIPGAPVGDAAQTICGAGTISDLKVSGANLQWYDAPTGGNILQKTEALVNGKHYYASQTQYHCESETRLEVVATLNFTPTPMPTGSASQYFCRAAFISDLVVTGDNIRWYTTASGGTALATSEPLINGGRYYASQTRNSCESSTRLEVSVTVNTTPKPTGLSTQTLCSGATVYDLSVTGSDIKWYASPTGGTALPPTTQPVIYNYYYATQTVNALESCSRLSVMVSIKETPAAPTGAATQVFCNTASVADLSATGTSILWYDIPVGGSLLSSSSALVNGKHYYATQTKNVCESRNLLDVEVVINTTPTPAPSGAAAQTLCEGSAVEDIAAKGTDLKWYAAASGGSPLPASEVLVNGGSYFATQTISACESSGRLETVITVVENKTPLPVITTPVKWQTIRGMPYFSFALKADGTLWGWGVNSNYQLADGTKNGKMRPVQITLDKDWVQVSGGGSHMQAIKADGSLWGWGYNYHGNIGDGGSSDVKVATRIGTATNWRSVAAGSYQSIGLKTDGTLWAWGDNYSDVIFENNGRGGFKRTPTQIGTDTDWKYIWTGTSHNAYAMKTDGTLWAWGSGYHGDNPEIPRSIPVKISNDTDWSMISPSGNHVLALKMDGTLWAWGTNSDGQLGDGTKTNSLKPKQIGSSSDWKVVSAGYLHSMAVKNDGTLWVWGTNHGFQLGDGTNPMSPPLQNYKLVPTQIGTDTDWQTVAAGYEQSLAIKTDGTLWAWGYNGLGEVGDGTAAIANAPKLIMSSSQVVCEGATIADLSVTGTDLQWFSSATGNEVLSPTTVLAEGIHYYAAQTLNSCTSPSRLDLTISKGTIPVDVPDGPSAQVHCEGATVADLKATGSHVTWYATPSGGAPLSPDAPLQNGNHYYASQSIGGCESGSRLEVSVTMATNSTTVPTGPSTQTMCAGATVASLTANGTDIKWYNAATGGSPIPSSTPLADGAHYYASQTSDACESLSRLAVAVTSTPAPTGNSSQTFCEGATIASIAASGSDIKWFDAIAGGAPLPSTHLLTHGSRYHASQNAGGCESMSRLTITATVVTIEAPSGSASQVFCGIASIADLTATGSDIKWYATETSTTPLAGATPLAYATKYFASQTSASCESSSRLSVTVTLNGIPYAPSPTSPGQQTWYFETGKTLSNLSVMGSAVKWYASAADAAQHVNPLVNTTPLQHNTTYYATQTVNGCESKASLTVTTKLSNPPDTEPPLLLTSKTPADGAQSVQVNTALKFAFTEMVTLNTGNISIFDASSNAMIMSIPLTPASAKMTGATIEVSPPSPLPAATTVYVKIDHGAFKDQAGNMFAGVADKSWSFTTASLSDTQAPLLVSKIPVSGSINVSPQAALSLTFNENVDFHSGSVSVLNFATDSEIFTFALHPANLAISGATVTITLPGALPSNTKVYFKIDNTSFKDKAGNLFAGITDKRWYLTTAIVPVDKIAPVIVSKVPATYATDVDPAASLVINFNEPVALNNGQLKVIYYADGFTTIEAIDLANSNTVIRERSVTVTPTRPLPSGTKVSIWIDKGVIRDLNGNAFNGITSLATWTFTTKATPDVSSPIVVSTIPANGATGVEPDATLTLKFNEYVILHGGTISVFQEPGARALFNFDLTSSNTTIDKNIVRITSPESLPPGAELFISIPARVFTDTVGNPFAGVQGKQWRFSTHQLITGIEGSDILDELTFTEDGEQIRIAAGSSITIETLSDVIGRTIHFQRHGNEIVFARPSGIFIIAGKKGDQLYAVKMVLR